MDEMCCLSLCPSKCQTCSRGWLVLNFCISGTKQPPLHFWLNDLDLDIDSFSFPSCLQHNMGSWVCVHDLRHSAALLCLLCRTDFVFCDHGHTLQSSLSDWGSQINGHNWKHWHFLKLQQRKQWLKLEKAKKGHSLLSIIFKESSVLPKTNKRDLYLIEVVLVQS